MRGFKCPKFETGVKCYECPYVDNCPFLHPPKPKPRIYPPKPQKPKGEFNPLPVEISKEKYRWCLLVGEDFKLTKPELQDLVYYASKFKSYAPRGGRGKSWRKVYAVTCILLLERDNIPVYTNNELYYNRRYDLHELSFLKIYKWAKDEIQRITHATFPNFWWKFPKSPGIRTSGSPGEQLAIFPS